MIQELDKKIIAYGLRERRILLNLQTSISVDYFHPDYKLFYKILIGCFDRFREVPTDNVMREFAGSCWNESLLEIYSEVNALEIDPREFPLDLEKLKMRYNKQLILKFGTEVFNNNYDGENFSDLDNVNLQVKKLVANINSIHGNKIFKEGSLSSTARDAFVEYKNVRDNPEIARGIHLGLREFDRITNGLHKSELLLIGGESGAGKSALAMQMAVNAWLGSNRVPDYDIDSTEDFIDDGTDVLYFTIEMPFVPLRRRVHACLGGIPANSIRDGKLTQNEYNIYKRSLRFQMLYPKQFHIVDIPRGCTMEQIESKYIEKCHEFDPKLIVVDYISLMTPDKEQGSDWLNVGRIAEQLHEFTRTYESSIISPVQLNRPQKGNENTLPDQHRVGRSIMLTQNCNILLNIISRKDEDLRPDMQIKIAKMRDGEKGSFVLHKRLDLMRIYDDVPGWEPELYDGYGG